VAEVGAAFWFAQFHLGQATGAGHAADPRQLRTIL
jgi:hypothetical protein